MCVIPKSLDVADAPCLASLEVLSLKRPLVELTPLEPDDIYPSYYYDFYFSLR